MKMSCATLMTIEQRKKSHEKWRPGVQAMVFPVGVSSALAVVLDSSERFKK